MNGPKKPRQFRNKTTSKKVFNPRKDRDNLYDADWVKYRYTFLHYNPTCYTCGEKATIVDHVVAHKSDPELFKDLRNHWPLCSICHNKITSMFDRYEPPKTEEKMQWVEGMRLSRNITTKIKVLKYYAKREELVDLPLEL